jgi:osmotically-inducible protein OsmY
MKTKLEKRWNRFVVTPIALCTVIAAIGCSSSGTSTSSSAGTRRTAGEFVDDTTTTYRVKKALKDDPYKYPDVNVTTRQGSVQLSGFVENREQRDRAENISKNVQGVRDVWNQISVKDESDRIPVRDELK